MLEERHESVHFFFPFQTLKLLPLGSPPSHLSTRGQYLLDLVLCWRSLKFPQRRTQIIPRSRTDRVYVHRGPKPARVIETPGHDTYKVRDYRRLGKQACPACRTEAAANTVPALPCDLVVAHIPRDSDGTARREERSGKRTSRCPLAIATVAIGSENWLGCTFVMDSTTHTTTAKAYRHEKTSSSIVKRYPLKRVIRIVAHRAWVARNGSLGVPMSHSMQCFPSRPHSCSHASSRLWF